MGSFLSITAERRWPNHLSWVFDIWKESNPESFLDGQAPYVLSPKTLSFLSLKWKQQYVWSCSFSNGQKLRSWDIVEGAANWELHLWIQHFLYHYRPAQHPHYFRQGQICLPFPHSNFQSIMNKVLRNLNYKRQRSQHGRNLLLFWQDRRSQIWRGWLLSQPLLSWSLTVAVQTEVDGLKAPYNPQSQELVPTVVFNKM